MTIHILPAELILLILQFTKPNEIEYKKYLFVCERWRQILTNYPFLKSLTYRGNITDIITLWCCEKSLHTLIIQSVYDSNFIFIPANVEELIGEGCCPLDKELTTKILISASYLKKITWGWKKYEVKSDNNGRRRIYDAEETPYTGETFSLFSNDREGDEDTSYSSDEEFETWRRWIEDSTDTSTTIHEEEWDKESCEIDYP